MGFSCPLEPLFKFDYRAPVSDDLIENELVHVFGGTHDGAIAPNPAEVGDMEVGAVRRSGGRHSASIRTTTPSGSASMSPPTAG